MAECGIKRWDEMPARVGIIGVDYLRYRYSTLKEQINRIEVILSDTRTEWLNKR